MFLSCLYWFVVCRGSKDHPSTVAPLAKEDIKFFRELEDTGTLCGEIFVRLCPIELSYYKRLSGKEKEERLADFTKKSTITIQFVPGFVEKSPKIQALSFFYRKHQ